MQQTTVDIKWYKNIMPFYEIDMALTRIRKANSKNFNFGIVIRKKKPTLAFKTGGNCVLTNLKLNDIKC